jgi:hypothetical protein
MRREEGCSSTAIDVVTAMTTTVWSNPAVRGSVVVMAVTTSAVP